MKPPHRKFASNFMKPIWLRSFKKSPVDLVVWYLWYEINVMNWLFLHPYWWVTRQTQKWWLGFGLVCFWTFFRFPFWRLLHGPKVLQLYTCQLTTEKKTWRRTRKWGVGGHLIILRRSPCSTTFSGRVFWNKPWCPCADEKSTWWQEKLNWRFRSVFYEMDFL